MLDNLLAHEVTGVCQAIADYHAYLAPYSPACISTKLLGYCLFMDGATAHPLRSGQFLRMMGKARCFPSTILRPHRLSAKMGSVEDLLSVRSRWLFKMVYVVRN